MIEVGSRKALESEPFRLRQALAEVNAALAQQRRDNDAQERMLRAREDAMKTKDLELQASILRFAQFLQQNEGKRSRAARRVQEETSAEEAARVRAETLAAELRDAHSAVETLRKELAKIQRYQDFLVKVAQSSNGEFATPDSIIERHSQLQTAGSSLMRQHLATLKEVQACRSAAATASAAARAQAQELQSRLSGVQASCHVALQRAEALQAVVDAAQAAELVRQRDEWRVRWWDT
ncbi:Coiled-coil domain-containing protein 42-like protein [Auxenochlorella protothecoides]|uniref:Coiled-coil domain-containing protein 42-like protein n=1 Tax=Auxenochlorella protothecoides TaxID=3075 RepID=A0A087SCE9_AUXPR|nr:Coiled-coil domain-containing protein 42-like protein [Auxenochlorella protothecoides]KFM23403.1 Coiled-coil domain-containing protein 42-like protein [Auxenochlorella protothecoides]